MFFFHNTKHLLSNIIHENVLPLFLFFFSCSSWNNILVPSYNAFDINKKFLDIKLQTVFRHEYTIWSIPQKWFYITITSSYWIEIIDISSRAYEWQVATRQKPLYYVPLCKRRWKFVFAPPESLKLTPNEAAFYFSSRGAWLWPIICFGMGILWASIEWQKRYEKILVNKDFHSYSICTLYLLYCLYLLGL